MRGSLGSVRAAFVCSVVVLLLAGISSAEVFVVLDDTDQIPALEGTLRWAIEQSEHNPGPDRIEFAIDFANVELVAPLPDLTDGGLALVQAGDTAAGPGAPPVYTIDGRLGVERALAIRSPGNRIGGLRFVHFSGPEVILVAGGDARDTVISGSWFGDPTTDEPGGSAAALRIAANPASGRIPEGVRLVGCGLVNNGAAVVIEGGPSPAVPHYAHPPTIRRCWFGTSAAGGPGPGNGTAISVAGAPLRLLESRFSGPGQGVELLSGASRSVLRENLFGATRADGTAACRPLGPSAVHVEGARNVVIDGNEFRCVLDGIALGAGADGTLVNQNLFHGFEPAAFPGSAVLLSGADGSTIARNTMMNIGGDGIRSEAAAGPANILTCNRIFGVGGRPIAQFDPLVPPPDLLASAPLVVTGQTSTASPGWIELFTDETSQAQRFLGAMDVPGLASSFDFALPAGLRIEQIGSGTALGVGGDLAAHTATWTPRDPGETSELSPPLPVGAEPPLFDLVRGNVGRLAPLPAGGVDLGPLDCLVRGAAEGFPVVSDEKRPLPGEAFFYLSRRRSPSAVAEVGPYGSPLCLDLLDLSLGDRIEGPGGCDN